MLEGYTQHIGIDSPDDVYADVDTGVYCPDNYMFSGAALSPAGGLPAEQAASYQRAVRGWRFARVEKSTAAMLAKWDPPFDPLAPPNCSLEPLCLRIRIRNAIITLRHLTHARKERLNSRPVRRVTLLLSIQVSSRIEQNE